MTSTHRAATPDQAAGPSGRTGGRRRASRRSSRPLLVAGVVLLVLGLVVLAGSAWLGLQGRSAANALESARAALEQTRAALARGDVAQAQQLLGEAQQQTAQAHHDTSGLLFDLATVFPAVGRTAQLLQTVSATADDVTHGPLADLLAAATSLDPRTVRISGSRFDVAAIAQAAPELAAAADGLARARADLGSLELGGTSARVSDAVTSFASQLAQTESATRSAAQAVSILPAMLGADGPRTYFLALQSNNELRGTGGFFGAFGLVEVDDGQLRIKRLAPSSNVSDVTFDRLPVRLGRDYQQLYGDQAASWSSANLSPNFPYAARLWRAMYDVKKGIEVDGVIAVDPVTLQYLLASAGPIELPDGRTLDASQIVAFTENEVYGLIADDTARDAYLQLVAKAAFKKIFSGAGSPRGLLDGLQRAASERRVLVWSSRPGEEAVIARTAVGGVIPPGQRPFAGLAVNNVSGNKMDYYLRAGLDYAGRSCLADGSRATRTTVTLTNTAAAGAQLPGYVSQRADLPPGPDGLPRPGDGSYRVAAQVYATQGAVLESATLDGRPVAVATEVERGKPVFRVSVLLPPGRARSLTLDLTEPPLPPGVDPAPTTFVTPMVQPSTTTVAPLACPAG